MLRLLIYGVPGSPIFEVGGRLSEFHRLDYYTIERVPEGKDSYFDDKIPEVLFDTGDFMSGSESQHMVRDPQSLRIDKEIGDAEVGISNAGPIEDFLSQQEQFIVDSINQGVIVTDIPDLGLVDWATHVVFLYTDEKFLINWFAKRLTCPSCKTMFHLEEKPPVTIGKCDRCGTTLERKEGDEPVLIHEQFKAWKSSFWKFDDRAREKEFRMINVDKVTNFRDLVSRINLWARDAIVVQDSWYSTA
jgi:Zn-finger nucleic acid-binding protein